MATCKYCGATIDWVKTRSGKSMPVEPELVSVDDCEPDTVLVTRQGDVIRVTEFSTVNGFECDTAEGYVSHFAFCSGADIARKK